MEGTLFSVLMLALILGIKHAIEPDHVIAVSTIASQSKKLWQASLAGIFWGIGHTKGQISEKWSMSLEFLVGIMLVYLGVKTILSFKNSHVHTHQHKHLHTHQSSGDHKHRYKNVTYLRSTFIGLVHGLAGSGAMVLLTISTVKSIEEAAIYILIFGAGTVIGMLFFTTIIGIPFVLSKKRGAISGTLGMATGVISAVFGVYYMYNLGINEGLFNLWI
ncbi:sulfite exporter TauE/SafE family protein [Bacillus haynesii]|uniref:urease accessory protein UreH domain-containing protein n=1 Tax=Bacillus haynesii TaxID=1925021 RepID=UPI0022808A64|nr:sulfite exporter TauE/SafE family protein [Bacillus haynesii]MCY8216785.1 sulfite exporter TauE/SafE family protein [Bacillus haynesii]MCY8577862.1 sulfite exporter TauE/SafE family protein [Bacillus haynesii]MCY8608970.1 sulfite exporter TauE/SafE family protein [Bacillus haynesii]MCY8712955.1 sulfite exporter TauE/SafE family protein [Bacillus haynesii]MCY8740789.1 sulfite exporter TauE/SafE family protein [Bacillus haynesii]